jgi:hypothetical protein
VAALSVPAAAIGTLVITGSLETTTAVVVLDLVPLGLALPSWVTAR